MPEIESVLLKTYLGVDISVDTLGRFTATLSNRMKKTSKNLVDVERFLTDNAPRGRVELQLMSGSFLGDRIIATGFEPAPRSRGCYSCGVNKPTPRVATTRGEYHTYDLSQLRWPDDALDADLKALKQEEKDYDQRMEERKRALAVRYRRVTHEDLEAALEASTLTDLPPA